jgi:hypothetical protein
MGGIIPEKDMVLNRREFPRRPQLALEPPGLVRFGPLAAG